LIWKGGGPRREGKENKKKTPKGKNSVRGQFQSRKGEKEKKEIHSNPSKGLFSGPTEREKKVAKAAKKKRESLREQRAAVRGLGKKGKKRSTTTPRNKPKKKRKDEQGKKEGKNILKGSSLQRGISPFCVGESERIRHGGGKLL